MHPVYTSEEFEAILTRIYAVTGCKSQSELAKFLAINQSSVSEAKKRGALPAEWLVRLLREKGLSPDWILTGMGSPYLKPSEGAPDFVSKEIISRRPPEDCSIEELTIELARKLLGKL